jgi:hypothetical protein
MTQTNWTSLGKPTVTIKSSPAVGQNADGRLEVFTTGSDGTLWHIWQNVPNGTWHNWDTLNKPPTANALTMPGVGKNADGRLEVFTIGTDGALWHIWQTTPNGAWGNWFSSGQPSTSQLNAQFPPFIAHDADGRLEAFTIGADGALWHIYQVAVNGTWRNWTPRGKPPGVNTVNAPFVGQNADGRLEVFSIGSDGALWHVWQTTPNGTWGNWFSSGQPSASIRNTSLAVSQNHDGRLEAFTIGSDGALWHIWQTTPNGAWSNWTSLGLPNSMSITSPPTIEINKDGRLEVLVCAHDGALWHIWQTAPGSVWGNWDSLGTPPSITLNSSPFVSKNDDGRLEAFVNGSDGALWHCWQVTPGGLWGSSTPMIATITITPDSRNESNIFQIIGVTGTPDPAQHQVQARILSATSPTQSKNVPSTGSIPGMRATGELTFLNNTAQTLTFGSLVLRGASGVPVSFNGPVTVPASPGFLNTTGFAVNAGSPGNILALDINGSCCAPGINVKNAAFSGGQDPQPNSIVQQSDIDGAANVITASLTPGTQTALQSQVHSNEQVVPNTFACQKSTFNANHAPGDHAPNVVVTVAITCTEEVFDQQAALKMASILLAQQAANQLGPNYVLTGNIVCSVKQATIVDANGTVSLLVQAQGMWVYQFSNNTLKGFINHIANVSQQNALQYLTSQPGVASAQIEFSQGNTLPDAAHIKIVIKVVPGVSPS